MTYDKYILVFYHKYLWIYLYLSRNCFFINTKWMNQNGYNEANKPEGVEQGWVITLP